MILSYFLIRINVLVEQMTNFACNGGCENQDMRDIEWK